MNKLNAQRAQYFRYHQDAPQFYFTCDDMAFDNEDNAISHAAHLKARHNKSNEVDTISRADFDTWNKAKTKPENEVEPESEKVQDEPKAKKGKQKSLDKIF